MAGNATLQRARRPKKVRVKSTNKGVLAKMAPPPSTIMYTGPIGIPSTDESTVTLYDSFDVSLLLATQLQLLFDNNPSAARNWTEYSTAWKQYRVLGIRYRYYPSRPVNLSGEAGFGVQSIVHGTYTAPASLAQAMSSGIARPWQVWKAFTREWKMQEVNEAGFTPTSAPAASSNTLLMYASAPGSAIDIGTVMIEYLVQFKNHAL